MKKVYKSILEVTLILIIVFIGQFFYSKLEEVKESFRSDSEKYYCNNILILSSKSKEQNDYGDKSYAVVLRTNEGKKIVERIKDKYIKDSNVDENDIMAIEVETNIKYEECEGLVEDSIESIAERIIEENQDNSIVKVDLECKEVRLEEIPYATKEVYNNDLYIGESKKEEGTSGVKEVVAKVKYRNGVRVDEQILSENTLLKERDTVIYIGRKNPIDDGVTFLIHPTKGGIITSAFGYRWGKKHNGIDIGHKEGDDVYSAFDGVIKECKYDSGYGNKIIVEHENNIETVYAHLSKFDTSVGSTVKAGELIGRVGSTGKSTGPHLHFEVRINGVAVNPEKYIKS